MFGYYGLYFDPTYVLVLIGVVICMGASAKMNGTFQKYAKVRSRSGMTGGQAAERILRYAGIHDVRVEHVSGRLSDHYDPSRKVLRLSDDTYHSTSVAALGVAAHECGHAVQHQKGYGPLRLRSMLVPAANLGSSLGIPLILLGVFLGLHSVLVPLGIWIFSLSVVFQLVTLPVEFNASSRALELLQNCGLTDGKETQYCRKVLSAAALTYVAAAASSILQLLRLVLLFGNRRDDD